MKFRSNQGITKLKALTNIKGKVMKQQFDLSLWLKDKSRKVVTRRGNPVRIICTDRKHGEDTLPIVFLEESPDGIGEFLLSCRADGARDNYDTPYDLFFADEEERLSEFEKDLQIIISEASNWISDDGSISTCCQFGDKEIKRISVQILDLARKEILKDLPKLEKTKDVIDPTIPVMYTNAASMKSYVEYNGYKLCINDAFEKLPKEE